ncbi:MAG: hypothetical protein N2645_10640 [Clostridia bacterium]|nr:hypothetical protein [Clostridia bacterium]
MSGQYNYIVKEVEKLEDTITNAFKIVKQGRPGTVLAGSDKVIKLQFVI